MRGAPRDVISAPGCVAARGLQSFSSASDPPDCITIAYTHLCRSTLQHTRRALHGLRFLRTHRARVAAGLLPFGPTAQLAQGVLSLIAVNSTMWHCRRQHALPPQLSRTRQYQYQDRRQLQRCRQSRRQPCDGGGHGGVGGATGSGKHMGDTLLLHTATRATVAHLQQPPCEG